MAVQHQQALRDTLQNQCDTTRSTCWLGEAQQEVFSLSYNRALWLPADLRP
jgi:hypothetical protein